jgi:poly(3-hydroxybutyrate) depolymerase
VIPSVPAEPPDAPPTKAATTWESLEVEGYLPAVLGVPPDDGRARPLLVATHGAGGRPEAHCARWFELVGTRAFILCTRGREMDMFLPKEERGFFYDGHHELGKEVVRAIEALRARHGARVDTQGAVFAGYSQGASMGALFLHEKREYAAMFARVILVEGGAKEWTVPLAERMREVGVKRVGVFCGQASCHQAASKSVAWMQRAGLEAREIYSAGAGHTYMGDVGVNVEKALPWLFEGDPRWIPAFE